MSRAPGVRAAGLRALLALLASLCGCVPGQAEELPRSAVASAPSFPVQLTTGLHYWYSWEQIRYGFYNEAPRAGNPSSSLDWTGMSAQSGEAFFRLQHVSSGLFVKALGGLGAIGHGGQMLDRDFHAGQVSFSALKAGVDGARLDYAIVDIGAEIVPFPSFLPDLKVSPFVGYHGWDDNPVSRGIACDASDTPRADCAASAAGILFPSDVKALSYAARWDALRIGLGAAYPLFGRLTVRGEFAWVPYARYAVEDSHYLRQDPDPRLGIGPVPNVFFRGAGQGLEAEAFLDYALTSSFVLGVGARYWGLSADGGQVRNGLSIKTNPVTLYDQERYGLLIEASYAF